MAVGHVRHPRHPEMLTTGRPYTTIHKATDNPLLTYIVHDTFLYMHHTTSSLNYIHISRSQPSLALAVLFGWERIAGYSYYLQPTLICNIPQKLYFNHLCPNRSNNTMALSC